MKHTCHARECKVPVPPERLMCLMHWQMVPQNIRKAVWQHYRDGQCDDKRPSKAWHEAADAAIGWVAVRENRKITRAEATALKEYGFEKWVPRAS